MGKIPYAGLTIIVLYFTPFGFAQTTHPHDHAIEIADPELSEKTAENDIVIPCRDQVHAALAAAVHEFVLRDNPGGTHEIRLQTVNGLQCESRSNMADITLVVKVGPNRYRYGIFHIHFSHDGRFIRTSGTNKQSWKETSNPDAWKTD